MTIKKRLFISNILMIVIPAVLAVIVLAGCLFVFVVFAVPHSEYQLGIQEELTEIREEAVELAAVWLAAAGSTQQMDAETRLLRLSERNRLMIQIQEGQDTIRQFGTQTVPSQNQLEQALAALNGSGTVSDGTFALFGTPLFLNGTTYQIHLYNPEVT